MLTKSGHKTPKPGSVAALILKVALLITPLKHFLYKCVLCTLLKVMQTSSVGWHKNELFLKPYKFSVILKSVFGTPMNLSSDHSLNSNRLKRCARWNRMRNLWVSSSLMLISAFISAECYNDEAHLLLEHDTQLPSICNR